MLTDLNLTFSVIGLSEIKIKVIEDPLLNTEMPGYVFESQPTLSIAGGVGEVASIFVIIVHILLEMIFHYKSRLSIPMD